MNCHYIQATIKVRHEFVCARCGKMEVGFPASWSGSVWSREELAASIPKPTSHVMPVGWCFTNANEFVCKECH